MKKLIAALIWLMVSVPVVTGFSASETEQDIHFTPVILDTSPPLDHIWSDPFYPPLTLPAPPSIKNLPRPHPLVYTVKTSLSKTTPSVQDAKNYARLLLGATQYGCLDQIFTHESHWNPTDLNKSSGAYGIPQALPASKMAWAGVDWKTNPITQVKWGLHYIDGRYGTPCGAWAFWKVHYWY